MALARFAAIRRPYTSPPMGGYPKSGILSLPQTGPTLCAFFAFFQTQKVHQRVQIHRWGLMAWRPPLDTFVHRCKVGSVTDSVSEQTMKPPTISHLQAATLDALSTERSGRELRADLTKRGFRQSSPAFYRLMGRLEDMKLVEGKYQNTTVATQVVRERRYKILADGIQALQDAQLFYLCMQTLGGKG